MGMRFLGMPLLLLAGCGAPGSSPTGVEILAAPPPTVAASSVQQRERAAECSLAWEPHRLGASVVTIPPEMAARMMAPVVSALCACTEPGSLHAVVVDFEPGRGRAAVHDGAEDEMLDHCLEQRLGDDLYPAFELGSDCIDCGPKRYGVFGGPPPEPPRGARIRLPLQVDRSGETL